jgi:glycine cleavage system aminomethyltransferase T
MALAEMNVDVGRVVYTSILDQHGGFKADLTIMRLGDGLFRIVTGGLDGPRDRKWFEDHLPEDGSAALDDVTSAWCTLGVWGPRARDLLASTTSADLSHEAFPFARCRWIDIGPVRVLASRISYVGELGWELYAPMEQGAALWNTVWEAGQPFGIVPAGIGVYGTTGRIEKCYRLRSSARSRSTTRPRDRTARSGTCSGASRSSPRAASASSTGRAEART